MDTQKIIRKQKPRKIHITIRISKQLSDWLRKKNYSPTAIFHEAVKDLGYQEVNN